ncbi:MAG: hypothetical protein LBN08_06515 [Lactobacillales bacterium]|jgi:cytoskeletal protein RodZ|nr:hypothetical protein [Lactobacillales bacterium]
MKKKSILAILIVLIVIVAAGCLFVIGGHRTDAPGHDSASSSSSKASSSASNETTTATSMSMPEETSSTSSSTSETNTPATDTSAPDTVDMNADVSWIDGVWKVIGGAADTYQFSLNDAKTELTMTINGGEMTHTITNITSNLIKASGGVVLKFDNGVLHFTHEGSTVALEAF